MVRMIAAIGLNLGLTLLVVGLVAPFSVAQEKQSWDVTAAAQGRSTFKTYCSACHGLEAKGDGALAEDLRTKPADLTKIAERNGGEFPYDIVSQIIDNPKSVPGHGSSDMPAWGDAFLTTDSEEGAKSKIDSLTHFLWSIQEKSEE